MGGDTADIQTKLNVLYYSKITTDHRMNKRETLRSYVPW